jgi:hypothetical protein
MVFHGVDDLKDAPGPLESSTTTTALDGEADR